jgi:hypothetical protein
MTRETILLALDHLHTGGYEGLDPSQPTPRTYAEYVAALLPGETAHSEADMLAAAAEQAEIEAAIAAAPTPESRLAALGGIYDDLPETVQYQFAGEWVNVMALVERDRLSLARGYVAGLTVPAELEATRAAILAHLED